MAQSPNHSPILVPTLSNLVEVRDVMMQKLNDLQSQLVQAFPPTNFQGSRLTNVGPPQAQNDAVNLAYLQQSQAGVQAQLAQQPATQVQVRQFTPVLQAGLATMSATLGAGQSGLLVNVTDYAHVLQWTGSGWQRGPGDTEHSDTFHWFGSSPGDVGWASCTGGTAHYLQYNGSLGTRTLPDLTTAEYLKATAATYSPAGTAALPPTLAGASTGAAVTGISVSPATAASGNIPQGTGAPITALVPPFTGGGAVTDPGHTHSISSATTSLPGDPIAHIPVIVWYRQ